MTKLSVLLMAFLATIINGLYVPNKGDTDKRGISALTLCQTNSDCQRFGQFGSSCLIKPSTEFGVCVMYDEYAEKRALSYSVGFGCQRNQDCYMFGFQAKCHGGICTSDIVISQNDLEDVNEKDS